MMKNLTIRNYKSIKGIEIHPKRVNVFIGEHNSGKSNLVEALSWFSTNSLNTDVFKQLFRFKIATDFFYDFDATNAIEIKSDNLNMILKYAKNKHGALLNHFEGIIFTPSNSIDSSSDFHNLKEDLSNYVVFTLSFDGEVQIVKGTFNTRFRTYSFKRDISFQNTFNPFLNPPFGENIPSLLISNKEYKDLVSSLFREKGFRLMLKPNEGDISMAKDVNDELYAYPYTSISETLQRIVFYTLAIESNRDSILVLDEPESNTFPMYTKQMAELISLDTSNQYFIATHNPYLLGSIISKTPVEDLAVFITEMENYETTVKEISSNKMQELMDAGIDFFFNLDKFVDE